MVFLKKLIDFLLKTSYIVTSTNKFLLKLPSTILYLTPIYLQYYTKLPYIYNIIPNSHISTILYKILSSFSNSLISTILYKIFAKGHSRNITAMFALKFFISFQFQFFSGHHGRDRVVANNYLCNQCLSPLTL